MLRSFTWLEVKVTCPSLGSYIGVALHVGPAATRTVCLLVIGIAQTLFPHAKVTAALLGETISRCTYSGVLRVKAKLVR